MTGWPTSATHSACTLIVHRNVFWETPGLALGISAINLRTVGIYTWYFRGKKNLMLIKTDPIINIQHSKVFPLDWLWVFFQDLNGTSTFLKSGVVVIHVVFLPLSLMENECVASFELWTGSRGDVISLTETQLHYLLQQEINSFSIGNERVSEVLSILDINEEMNIS